MATSVLLLDDDSAPDQDATASLDSQRLDREVSRARLALLLVAALSIPLLLMSVTHRAALARPSWLGWLELGFTLPIAALTLARARTSLLRRAGAPFLVAALVAVCVSIGALISARGEAHAPPTAALVVGCACLSWLAAHAGVLQLVRAAVVRTASPALVGTVKLVTRDGECAVAWDRVQPGSFVRVNAGELVRCDGWLVEGASELDGREVGVGDRVLAGMHNGLAPVLVEVTRVRDTQRSQLSERLATLVDDAPWQAPHERWLWLSHAFVVLGVFTGWAVTHGALNAVMPALAVLLLAPSSWLTLAAHLPRLRWRLATAEALLDLPAPERFAAAALTSVLVLDKGLLDSGDHRVSAVHALGGHTDDEVLALGAALLCRHPHRAARAVRFEAAKRTLAVAPVRGLVEDEQGCSGTVMMRERWAGSLAYARARANLSTCLDERALSTSIVVVGEGDRVLGWLGIVAETGASTRAELQQVREAGVRPLLVSADLETVVQRSATSAGVDTWHAVAGHAERVGLLAELARQGVGIAACGDRVQHDWPVTLAVAHGDELGPIVAMLSQAKRLARVERWSGPVLLGVLGGATLAAALTSGTRSVWGAALVGVVCLTAINRATAWAVRERPTTARRE